MEYKEIEPCSVANEEVGNLRKKGIEIWERSIRGEVGFCFKL